jgi:carbonic anhydrase
MLEGAGPPTIDPAALVPDERTHVRYDGSLTVPPYTEGVAWYVLTTPATLSAEQLRALEAVHRGNNRELQPLHDRAFR